MSINIDMNLEYDLTLNSQKEAKYWKQFSDF